MSRVSGITMVKAKAMAVFYKIVKLLIEIVIGMHFNSFSKRDNFFSGTESGLTDCTAVPIPLVIPLILLVNLTYLSVKKTSYPALYYNM
jgi:hypothetical protein